MALKIILQLFGKKFLRMGNAPRKCKILLNDVKNLFCHLMMRCTEKMNHRVAVVEKGVFMSSFKPAENLWP